MRLRRIVVLPEPRNPVMTVMGIGVIICIYNLYPIDPVKPPRNCGSYFRKVFSLGISQRRYEKIAIGNYEQTHNRLSGSVGLSHKGHPFRCSQTHVTRHKPPDSFLHMNQTTL